MSKNLEGQYDNENDSELENLERISNKMNEDIRNLWDNVVVPYLRNDDQKQILGKLNEHEYIKFYKFMVENSDFCKYVKNATS